MVSKIEQLLQLVADMEKFSDEVQRDTMSCDPTELSYEELNLVAAAVAQPNKPSPNE